MAEYDKHYSPALESFLTKAPAKTSHLEAMGTGMFPPAFNKLRQVLYEEHHDLWQQCGGMMIHNHAALLEFLNTELDTTVVPSHGITNGCEIWLKLLAKRPKVWRRG